MSKEITWLSRVYAFLFYIVQLDYEYSKRIQCSKLSDQMEYYLAIPAMLFGRHCIPYLLLLSFLLFRFRYACYFALSSGITVILTEFLKIITNRARPRKQSIADRSLPIRDDVSNPAFPSGDSAQAAVVAGCCYLRTHCSLFLFLPCLTMYGRVYFGAHWIGDTVAGSIIGFAVTFAITPFVYSFLYCCLLIYIRMKIVQISTGSRYAKLDEDITFTIKYDASLTERERNTEWSVRYVPDIIFRDQYVDCNVTKRIGENEVILQVNDFKSSLGCYSLIELRNVGCFTLHSTLNNQEEDIVLIVQTYSEDEVNVVLERAVEQYSCN